MSPVAQSDLYCRWRRREPAATSPGQEFPFLPFLPFFFLQACFSRPFFRRVVVVVVVIAVRHCSCHWVLAYVVGSCLFFVVKSLIPSYRCDTMCLKSAGSSAFTTAPFCCYCFVLFFAMRCFPSTRPPFLFADLRTFTDLPGHVSSVHSGCCHCPHPLVPTSLLVSLWLLDVCCFLTVCALLYYVL